MSPLFSELTASELETIKSRATLIRCQAGERLFSTGDAADYIYFIDSGHVSIFIEKFNYQEELQVLGPGECFGEMAVFFNGKRTASAATREDSTFLGIAKQTFLELLESERDLAEKIKRLLSRRNEELILKEKLIDAIGLGGKHLHIGIKGDPSLRESALTRERYESEVDKIMPELVPRLEDLMLNRCAYQIFIGFNNGEIRVSSILDPFGEEFHPARRLLDETYVDRHFPVIGYEDKAEMIRGVYQSLGRHPFFSRLPDGLRTVFGNYYAGWQPLPPQDIARTISCLPLLRDIPNYYVRNATVSLIKDAIHMQFNCDGAHIVSAEDCQRFLEENL